MQATYTAYRNGHVFVDHGTWEQVEKILAIGYCVASREYRGDGSVGIGLGLVIGAAQSRHVIDGYNVEFQSAKPARASEDY